MAGKTVWETTLRVTDRPPVSSGRSRYWPCQTLFAPIRAATDRQVSGKGRHGAELARAPSERQDGRIGRWQTTDVNTRSAMAQSLRTSLRYCWAVRGRRLGTGTLRRSLRRRIRWTRRTPPMRAGPARVRRRRRRRPVSGRRQGPHDSKRPVSDSAPGALTDPVPLTHRDRIELDSFGPRSTSMTCSPRWRPRGLRVRA